MLQMADWDVTQERLNQLNHQSNSATDSGFIIY
jgi:hypothetical protein